MLPHNIIIGTPLVSLSQLGITQSEFTITDEEKFLPKLLVKYGSLNLLHNYARIDRICGEH